MASQQEEDFAALVEKMNRLEKENEDLRRKLEEKEMGGVKEQESVAPGVSLQVEVEVEGLTFLPSDASCGEERDEKVKVVGKDDDQKMSDDKDEKVDEDSGESIVVLDGIHELLERKEELPKEEIHDPGLQGLSPVSVEKILLFPDDEEDNKVSFFFFCFEPLPQWKHNWVWCQKKDQIMEWVLTSLHFFIFSFFFSLSFWSFKYFFLKRKNQWQNPVQIVRSH